MSTSHTNSTTQSRFKLGCDPEFFVTRDGKGVSPHEFIKGDKNEPYPVPFGAVQVDGLAVEFNIEPVETPEGFYHNVQKVMATLEGMIKENGCQPNYGIEHTFDAEFVKTLPPKYRRLGCDPDWNAYNMRANRVIAPEKMGLGYYRTAAGHVHIGWDEGLDPNDPVHLSQCATIAKELDITLAMPLLKHEGPNRRRTLYGGAGAFRPKPYGVEYRVLSNVWLLSREMTTWVAQTTLDTMCRIFDGRYYQHPNFSSHVCHAINNCDTDQAEFLMARLNYEPLPM